MPILSIDEGQHQVCRNEFNPCSDENLWAAFMTRDTFAHHPTRQTRWYFTRIVSQLYTLNIDIVDR